MIKVFGFPVRINIGFIIFAGLILMLNPTRFGAWLVGGLTVFTLIHEFGHAVVARHYGAQAEISLGFMAGYTSYRPGTTAIRPFQRAAISVAGPVIQILVGALVMLALGRTPFALPNVSYSDAQLALWWAGPMIGILNLIPVLPLDGGHLVQNVLTGALGRSVAKPMLYFSLALTAGTALYFYSSGQRGFTYFIAFLLFAQFQIWQSTSARPASDPSF